MRRFDTVLFDLDGTLLDTLEDICGAANHTLRELGYPERTLAEMRRFVGNGAEMQMRRALGADADEETVAKALALYKPYYAAHCQIKTKPYAGVLELMAALKAEGFRLAVVSNKPDEAVRPLVAEHFGALADIAMGETAQRRRKPAPDMVNDALAALGATDARQCERELDVLQDRLVGNEVVALEHEANAVVAVRVPVRIRVVSRGNAVHDDVARVRVVEAAQDVEKRRLARARGAEHGHELTLSKRYGDAVERALHEVAGLV